MTKLMQDIPEKLFFGISEVARLCQVEASVLRYWEKQFEDLDPKKRANGRRYYTRQHVLLVRHIKHLLYDEGFTIEGAKTKLKNDQSGDATPQSKRQSDALLHDILGRLSSVHDQLVAVVDS